MTLPCFYNPPISYFALLLHTGQDVSIEKFDHYTKQTYRNRCKILGANGVINLVIPVIHEHGTKTFLKDTRIEYVTNWRTVHWRSIETAYASAPFFEYIMDEYEFVYQKKHTFLIDLNLELLQLTIENLGFNSKVRTTENYDSSEPGKDPEIIIHPKKEFNHPEFEFVPAKYNQVFSDKIEFQPDMSILDLLFNEGPNSRIVLEKSLFAKK